MQSGIVELDDSYAGRSAYALPALLAAECLSVFRPPRGKS